MQKTDPISAAAAYRMYFERILHADGPHQMRKLASAALDITFAKPEPGLLSVASGFGFNSKQPFVTIGMANPQETANPTIQIDVQTARQLAMQLLEAADAADSDGFVLTWLMEGTAELSEGQAATLLQDFRAYRERRRSED